MTPEKSCAIEQASRAVTAATGGDIDAAQDHIANAQRYARSTARRERQVVEIAALIVAGSADRAAGLALEHTAQFPDDAELMTHISVTSAPQQQRGSQ
jgi:hypothetical protein